LSRLDNIRSAVRPSLKARLMISSPAGGGKTWTALEIAAVLGLRTLVLDTEHDSSLTYAHRFQFHQLPWPAPFDPASLADAVTNIGGGWDTLIVDSFSHFWTGPGGTLDLADNKYFGWKGARPIHNQALEALLSAPCHVIVCCRSRTSYSVNDDDAGKPQINKLGLRAYQDEHLEYEMNVAIDMDMQHRITVTKSRVDELPVNTTFPAGAAGAFGERYRDWLAGGEPFANPAEVARLRAAIGELNDAQRDVLRKAWAGQGLPRLELLTVSGLARALELVGQFTLHLPPPAPSKKAASNGRVKAVK
jgi:hypothetical protein